MLETIAQRHSWMSIHVGFQDSGRQSHDWPGLIKQYTSFFSKSFNWMISRDPFQAVILNSYEFMCVEM